jgi:signal transduction histidine kinase
MIRLVSHETRTPLNIMTMGLKLLENKMNSLDIHDEEANDILQDTKAACNLAIQTLTEVLDFEKIASSAMTLEKETFDVLCIIKEVVNLFKVQVSGSTNGFFYCDVVIVK